ncbi:MAG: 4Fe-4S binding protein [bacterium]|nr:4Fe-4S binding protein [bacterium]
MGHLVGKDIYRELGQKIDGLTMRTPWNETFHEILKELYTMEEADVIVNMPFVLSDLNRILRVTKYEEAKLRGILESLCSKGLVMDLFIGGEYYYMISPLVIGFFEFTMMRMDGNYDPKKISRLFFRYMANRSFQDANFGKETKVSIMRTIPHEEAFMPDEYVEILDYEKAWSIIESSNKFSIGICSCRHEKSHIGRSKCVVPLDTCTSFGLAADYLIRRNLAKEVSKSEMLEHFARSKEMGLVLNADNVKNNVAFICQCCKCCCNLLLGVSKLGYANTIVTSNFISDIKEDKCTGCGLCVKKCPVNAIKMDQKIPKIDKSICLGCGVCALKCNAKAVRLISRGKRLLTPETTFERVILTGLEKGTLQNLMFDDPRSITHKFMRGFIGGFLKLPVTKKALMSDMFRSIFLSSMKTGVEMQGKGFVAK